MMSPDRERQSFTDAAPTASFPEGALRRGAAGSARPALLGPGARLPVAVASVSAWLLFVAIYAVLFTLSGATVARAIRGAFANGIPDGLLVLAAFRTARRMDVAGTGMRRLLLAQLGRGAVLVGLAFAAKTLLLWADVILLGSERSFRLVAGVVAWQTFVSALVYTASAAASHVWWIDRRLREEEARAARAEALRARAELSALRAQLNPHFLFNVLHSVLGMVRGDPALAEAALESLGDLLRYALRVHRDGVDRTALRHEWAFMETYLALEKIRLGDRLQAVRDAEEAALDRDVPTFSLQPLVENAVRHGIAPRAAGGRLAVLARLEGEALRLEVRNDGNGRSDAGADDEGGTGLRVLRDRLDVLYRGAARMTAGPTEEGGYLVVLLLPAPAEGTEAEP
jgi:histidine kinase